MHPNRFVKILTDSANTDMSRRVVQVVEIAERFLDQIGEGDIQSVWLIGSRAQNTARDTSDWDWLVVGEGFDDVEREKLDRLEAGEHIYGIRLDHPVATHQMKLRAGVLPNDIIFSSTPPESGRGVKVY